MNQQMKDRERAFTERLVRLGLSLACMLLVSACAGSTGNSTSTRSPSSTSGTQQSGGSSAPAGRETGEGDGTGERAAGGPNAEVCRKYEACGCQKYDECMASLENDPNIGGPGIRECMLKSSCQSLCAGRPDGCPGTSTDVGGGGGRQPANCAGIPCSSNNDCPTECTGGCGDSRVCLSF